MDDFSIELLKIFYISSQQVWKNMYEIHIVPVKKMFNIELMDPNIPLTTYIDYARKIRNSQTRLPDWWILSSGNKLQKIVPCFLSDFDVMGMILIDLHSIRSRTMMVYHQSETMVRNGMHVSDIITRNLFKSFSNPHSLTYIRTYCTSPEKCFMIKNHYKSYYQHLKYGLLDKNLRRIMLISARHLLLLIDLLKKFRSELVDEILLMDLQRGKFVQDVLFNKRFYNMDRIFEKLWPNLDMIIMCKHGSSRVHTIRTRKYIGNIKTYCPVFSIPETTIGYDINNDGTYTLDPRKGFFEFIPINEKYMTDKMNIDQIQPLRSLKIGDIYHLIVSGQGLDVQRYMTEEIVRIIGFVNRSPKLDIVCKDYELLLNNSHVLYPEQIEKILMKDFNLVDYCYRKESLIKIYIEIDESCYMSDASKIYDVKENIKNILVLKHIFDNIALKAEVRIVVPGTFNLLYENRYSEYVDPGMIQIPRIIENDEDLEIIREKILFIY